MRSRSRPQSNTARKSVNAGWPISVPLTRLDDYSFHSTLPASLIPGWIADAAGFDTVGAKRLLDSYRAVRHLLVGAWYPLLP